MACLYRTWFLRRYQETTIERWERIYHFMENQLSVQEESNENRDDANEDEDAVTRIRYKGLTVVIKGKIPEDRDLRILAKWEVSTIYQAFI